MTTMGLVDRLYEGFKIVRPPLKTPGDLIGNPDRTNFHVVTSLTSFSTAGAVVYALSSLTGASDGVFLRGSPVNSCTGL